MNSLFLVNDSYTLIFKIEKDPARNYVFAPGYYKSNDSLTKSYQGFCTVSNPLLKTNLFSLAFNSVVDLYSTGQLLF